jgi:hypothetical protein
VNPRGLVANQQFDQSQLETALESPQWHGSQHNVCSRKAA